MNHRLLLGISALLLTACGVATGPVDKKFGDQHMKTTIALVELLTSGI